MALAAPAPAGRAFVLLIVAAAVLRAETPEVVFSGQPALVEVRGVSPERLDQLRRSPPTDWSDLLAVYTEEASLAGGEMPPLMGTYLVGGSAVRFTPRFPFAQGVTYVARWRDSGIELVGRLEVPWEELPPTTTLSAIYPTAGSVPENLLRIYLQFSAPMSQGRAREHIRLLDASGAPVDGAFVAPDRELWSPDETRLTLFFDPGRIKRGVGPNDELGPTLRAGERYQLVVDHEFPDARGVPLVRAYYKEFTVAPPDREQPRTEQWRLTPPDSPTTEVRLEFPEPLDHGLLHGMLTVLDASDRPVEGRTVVHPGETAWSFRPQDGWGGDTYRIRVATLLEDLAGNSLRRPFEVRLGATQRRDDEAAYLDLPFAVQ